MADCTVKEKKQIAKKADKMQKAELSQAEIAKYFKIPVTTLKHWLRDYRDGKFDNPKKNMAGKGTISIKQVDTRPELREIAKELKVINESFRALTEGAIKVCMRLDSIYQKNSEDHETFDSLLAKGFQKAGNNKELKNDKTD